MLGTGGRPLSHSTRFRLTQLCAQMTQWSLLCWQNKHHINVYLLESSKSSNRSWTIMQFPRLNQRNYFRCYRNEMTWWQMIFSLCSIWVFLHQTIAALNRGAQGQGQGSPTGCLIGSWCDLLWNCDKTQQAIDTMKKIGSSYTGWQTHANIRFRNNLASLHCWSWVKFPLYQRKRQIDLLRPSFTIPYISQVTSLLFMTYYL